MESQKATTTMPVPAYSEMQTRQVLGRQLNKPLDRPRLTEVNGQEGRAAIRFPAALLDAIFGDLLCADWF